MTGRKKGVSIGAAMKQRMGSQEELGIQVAPPVPEERTPVPQPALAPDDSLESFNTRLPRSVLRRLKVHAAVNEVRIQDAIRLALEEYLTAHGS